MTVLTLACPVESDLAKFLAQQDCLSREQATQQYYRMAYLADMDISDMVSRTDVQLTVNTLQALFSNDIQAARSAFYTLMTIAADDYAETMTRGKAA